MQLKFNFWSCLILSWLLCCANPAAARGKFPLTLKLLLTSTYEDNILKYSSRDRTRFEDNLESYPSEITTLDDWVNIFGVRIYRDFRLGSDFRLRPYYSGRMSIYAVNQIKNSQSHFFLLRFSYKYRFYLYLKYFYLADYYLRIYKDRDLNEYHSCYFDLYRPYAAFRLRLPPYYVETEVGREFIYYNGYFTEYDSEAIFWGISASYWGIKNFNILLQYRYKVSDNIGFKQSPMTGSNSTNEDSEYGDASYQEDQYRLKSSYRLPLKSTWNWAITLALERRLRYYQSDLSVQQDPFHAGRKDRRDIIEPSLSFMPSAFLKLELQFSYDLRRTESPEGTVVNIKNYDDRSFEFAITYQVF